jgi:phage-related minor tail protein
MRQDEDDSQENGYQHRQSKVDYERKLSEAKREVARKAKLYYTHIEDWDFSRSELMRTSVSIEPDHGTEAKERISEVKKEVQSQDLLQNHAPTV